MACSIELGVDVESFSKGDIKSGAYAYAENPDFELLLVAYKFSDEDEVKQIDLLDAQQGDHRRFWEALTDPAIIKTAYNANFERVCFARYTGKAMPPEQWRCTMILAAVCGLPRSLGDVGKAMGLSEEEQKLKTGKALIDYFCKPCKATKANGGRLRNLPLHAPEKWELFKEYNRRDVVTEQAILDALKSMRPDAAEQELWTLDQIINDRGVMLDVDMAARIVEYDDARQTRLKEEASGLSGLVNPNSTSQLREWLESRGIHTETLKKDDVSGILAMSGLPHDVRRVLEVRQALSRTSVKKYSTMLSVACKDHRARGIMQFYGGHTGRWAGRALQPQNLARNSMPDDDLDLAHELVKKGEFDTLELLFGEPSEVFSQLVRTAFIPSEGCRFVVSDFSAIEARVIAWVAGEDWRTKVFLNDGDIYCESASRIYHVPVEKHGKNGHLRQRGKIAELALGYGGSVGAMKNMDKEGTVPEEEMAKIVAQWRKESPQITKMWRTVEKAAFAVVSGDRQTVSIPKLRGLTFCTRSLYGTKVMIITLPSGRPITYWDPKIIPGEMGDRLTYMEQNQTTRKWTRAETYGGKLTENIIQSIARDCLGEKMRKLNGMGYRIVFHVHDELILDVPREDENAASVIDAVMGEPIAWAKGLPLKGGTYECEYYRKD